MNIAFACDHAGFPLKNGVLDQVAASGHAVVDCGTWSDEPVDYPDFARRLGTTILAGRAARGVLVCGSGVGAAIAANKIPRIRAAVCATRDDVEKAIEHNDVNVLCLGARLLRPEVAAELVRAFLAGRFSGEPRHRRRLMKITQIEQDARAGLFDIAAPGEQA